MMYTTWTTAHIYGMTTLRNKSLALRLVKKHMQNGHFLILSHHLQHVIYNIHQKGNFKIKSSMRRLKLCDVLAYHTGKLL